MQKQNLLVDGQSNIVQPVGYYIFTAMGAGANVIKAQKPYFAARRVGLVSVKKDVTQILVRLYGEMKWINVYDESCLTDSPDTNHPIVR